MAEGVYRAEQLNEVIELDCAKVWLGEEVDSSGEGSDRNADDQNMVG